MSLTTTTDEDEIIIMMAKESECLYNKKHGDYYKPKVKNKVYEEMAAFLAIRLGSKLTPQDIKQRWECMRKAFRTAYRKDRTSSSMFQKLIFLSDHTPPIEEKGREINELENENMSSLYQSQPNPPTKQPDPPTKFDKHRFPKMSPGVTSNVFSKFVAPPMNKASPPVDKFAKRKADELDILEKQVVNVAEHTIQSFKTSGSEDCYEMAIKESLRSVNENVLDCVPGILNILLEYQNEN